MPSAASLLVHNIQGKTGTNTRQII